MSPWPLLVDPYLTGNERRDDAENRAPGYEGLFRPADRSAPGSLLYPFLTNITAVRAADSTRQALSLDVVAEAFDEGIDHPGDRDQGPEDASTDLPEDPSARSPASIDGADTFETQLRERVGELGDKALETRDLSRHHESIVGLIESSPSSVAGQAWAEAVAHSLRRASCAVDTIDRDRVNDDADEILRDLKAANDAMDRVVQTTVNRLSCVGESHLVQAEGEL